MKNLPAAFFVCMLAMLWPSHFPLLFAQTASAQSDPQQVSSVEKMIVVSLDNQTLIYYEGEQIIKEIKISSGRKATPTPTGEFEVLKKKPAVNYIGPGYKYPNTKWNLLFKPNTAGNYYIHGAFWHNKFGQPMSHGCVNVSYADMEPLYDWAEVGTKVIIKATADRHSKGTVVLSEGSVYYLGEQTRYLFPSEEIFYSWGHLFKNVLAANTADLEIPLGPVVNYKTD